MGPSFKKRTSNRSRVSIDGHYQYAREWYPCVLNDLSLAGAGLKINQIFVPGDNIRLRFGFQEDQRVVDATVANVNGTRIGVKFSVDPQTQDFLKAVIQAFEKPVNFRR